VKAVNDPRDDRVDQHVDPGEFASERIDGTRARREPGPAPGDIVPPSGFDGGSPPQPRDGELSSQAEPLPQIEGALHLLRRGLRESPELRAGIGYTFEPTARATTVCDRAFD